MREFFEDEHLEQNMAEVIYAIMPLYKNLFTYVRRKLFERYGDRIRKDGPLPAHIFGNMWSQNWEGIYDLVQPFPATTKLDVTLDMMIQGYTPLRYSVVSIFCFFLFCFCNCFTRYAKKKIRANNNFYFLLVFFFLRAFIFSRFLFCFVFFSFLFFLFCGETSQK